MKSPTLMTQSRVRIDEIVVRNRLRPVSEAGVESLLASIAEVGVMKDAIHVRKKKDGALWLVAGGHRLEAARRLGWPEIEAKVWTDVTDDWAQMMEIDDNLAGAEMNALDTAWFLATRKAVYERLHPETKKGVAGGLARQGAATDIVSFAESTAEKFGVSTRHVERMIAAGSRLGPDEIRQLRQAPRQVTLKDLTEIARIGDTAEKYRVVDLLAQGQAKSAAEARRAYKAATGEPLPEKDPVEEAFKALLNAWSRAPMAARRRFVHEVSDDLAAMEAQAE
jgi:ParB family chromosome partitioning protein